MRYAAEWHIPPYSWADSKLISLRWRHNEPDGVWNHQPRNCLLNHLFRPKSKKTSKLRVTGLCAGNSLGTGEFPAQMASNAENVSIWWRHHDKIRLLQFKTVVDVSACVNFAMPLIIGLMLLENNPFPSGRCRNMSKYFIFFDMRWNVAATVYCASTMILPWGGCQ